MQAERIQYRGSYQYADQPSLERAVTSARAELEDDELEDIGLWLRFFVRRGTSLTVNVTLPASAEHRFVAANVFLILAHGAIEGSVEAVRGLEPVDLFASGAED